MTRRYKEMPVKLAFLKIDDATLATLRSLRPMLEAGLDDLLARFYDHVTAVPELRDMFESDRELARVRGAQARHWQNMLEAQFDQDYQDRARRIGEAHHRADLSTTWYIGGYCFALNEITAMAVRKYRHRPKQLTAALTALNKAVFLDMDCAIEVYNDAVLKEREHRQHRVDALIADFEDAAQSILAETSRAGDELGEVARTMSKTADATDRQAAAVASASDQASANVQTVSSASEQLASSIAEITRQVAQSNEIADQAAREAEKTNETMQQLAQSAESIGRVVTLIRDIAEQTNLLALNATIEAARAGDAGKGFAVVAGEVKSLANQTAKATDDISQQVNDIQSVAQDAVQSIDGIGRTIDRINEIAGSIASAMEQQQAATSEISRNVQEAATGTQEVARNIADVTDGTKQTGAAAQQVDQSARLLNEHSSTLKQRIERFLEDVRAA